MPTLICLQIGPIYFNCNWPTGTHIFIFLNKYVGLYIFIVVINNMAQIMSIELKGVVSW